MRQYLNLERVDKNLAFIWYDLLNDEARRTAMITLVYITATSAMMLAMPYAIGLYLDGLAESDTARLLLAGGMFMLLHSCQTVLVWLRQRMREYFFQAAIWYMPQAITKMYFARPLRWLASGTSEIDGGGVESLMNASWNTLGNYIYGIIPGYTQIVFALVACMYANIWLGLISTLYVLVEFIAGRNVNQRMHQDMKPAVDIYKRAGVRRTEDWHNTDHVKMQGVETKVEGNIKTMMMPALMIDDQVWRVFFSWQISWYHVRYLAAALVLYGLLAYLVLHNLIALPLAVLVFFSFERIGTNLGMIQNEQRDVQSDLAKVNKYRPVLQTVSPIRHDVGTDFAPTPLSVSLTGVTHTVPDKEGDKVILQNVNLDIPAGQTVGVVGPSGAGKSQLLHLLVRGSDPQTGTVCVGGQNLVDVRMETLLRYYGNVLQKSEPFTGTVFENVLFGVSHFDIPDETDTVAWQQLRYIATQALAKAGLPITLFPDGLDERVGYKGMKLSGGQQQRLQIAGAHCKLMLGDADRPRLILADEPTASLDSLSEVKVMQHLQSELPEDTTMLMVAHRLSTVANLDKIVFVRPVASCIDGRPQVIMYESLADTYKNEALFREMADAQGFVPDGAKQVA